MTGGTPAITIIVITIYITLAITIIVMIIYYDHHHHHHHQLNQVLSAAKKWLVCFTINRMLTSTSPVWKWPCGYWCNPILDRKSQETRTLRLSQVIMLLKRLNSHHSSQDASAPPSVHIKGFIGFNARNYWYLKACDSLGPNFSPCHVNNQTWLNRKSTSEIAIFFPANSTSMSFGDFPAKSDWWLPSGNLT